MKCKTLKQLWGGLFKGHRDEDSPPRKQAEELQLAPLKAGLRVDLTVPHGAGRELTATQLFWVSPAGSDSRSVNALKVLLIPN
jgi:hypothetical protein